MTDHNLVAKARAKLEGTTPGPWRVDYDGEGVFLLGGKTILISDTPEDPNGPKRQEDWEFIASAPELVAALADRVEELEAELDKYCAKMDRLLGLDDDDSHD